MGFGNRLLMDGHHARDVEFVTDEIIPIQGFVILEPELEKDRLSPAQALGERQTEKAQGIGAGFAASQSVNSGDLYVRQGQLFVWINVLAQDRTSQGNGLPPVRKRNNQPRPQNPDKNPGHDFLSLGH
jgi:hypothetical protein